MGQNWSMMNRGRKALGTAAAVLIVVAVVAAGTMAYAMYTARQASPSGSGPERSGPISTYPRSWYDACGLPVQGNATTIVNELPTGLNITLAQVYSAVVNSASFKNISVGLGWVTTSWTNQEDSGPIGSHQYVTAQFVLLNASAPDGYVQANYNVVTGGVGVYYQRAPLFSCGA